MEHSRTLLGIPSDSQALSKASLICFMKIVFFSCLESDCLVFQVLDQVWKADDV